MSYYRNLASINSEFNTGQAELLKEDLIAPGHDNSGEVAVETKNILIHAINYAPERIGCAKYTAELSRFLQNRGHRLEVITAPPHYPEWSVEKPYHAFLYKTEIIDKITVTRCLMVLRRNGNGLWRLLGPLIFALIAAPMVLWRTLRSKPDIVVCVEPALFCAPAVLLAAQLSGARSFLHVQDLEVDAAFELGFLKNAKLKRIVVRIERLLLNRFDEIITISEKMRAALIDKGISAGKISVVRNWVNLETIKPRPSYSGNGFRDQLKCREDDFIVLYAGAMGAKQGLNIVLDAARHLSWRKDIVFIIAGDGPMKATLQRDYADLPNVHYLPLQDECRLGDLLSIANLHILPQGKAASDLVMPSKLGGMLASGRQIVVTAEAGSELANILEDIALIVPPGDSAALADVISRSVGKDFSPRIERGLRLSKCWNSHDVLLTFEKHLLGPASKPKKPKDQHRPVPYQVP